jgi:hypothetical protein
LETLFLDTFGKFRYHSHLDRRGKITEFFSSACLSKAIAWADTMKGLLTDITDEVKEEIEQIIEEKKWDMEYSEDADADMDTSDLFFDIIKLENSIAYLNGIKKQLSKNIILINTILDKF